MIGKYMFPGVLERVYLYSVAGWEVYLREVILASLAIIIFGYISIKGTEISGVVQTLLTTSLIASIIIIFMVAIFSRITSFSNFMPLFSPSYNSFEGTIGIIELHLGRLLVLIQFFKLMKNIIFQLKML